MNWGPTHKKLVEEQKEFNGSGDAVRMLEAALQDFPKLQHVRMDTFL
jgi:hypothetical protein